MSFGINDRVTRAKERLDEVGTIVEISAPAGKPCRYRVLWDGDPVKAEQRPECNYYRPKRTWVNGKGLIPSNS
jgi:hypothetical protein